MSTPTVAEMAKPRGYHYRACGVSGWVVARSRNRARYLIAYAIHDAGFADSIGEALRRVDALRLDPRADAAPVLSRWRDEGLVPNTWKPTLALADSLEAT